MVAGSRGLAFPSRWEVSQQVFCLPIAYVLSSFLLLEAKACLNNEKQPGMYIWCSSATKKLVSFAVSMDVE